MRHPLVILAAALSVAACTNKADLPPMITASSSDNQRAEALFSQARQAEEAGKSKKAADLYKRIATEVPFSDKAAQANFRQAQLLDQLGDTTKAFDAYQNVIARYSSSGLFQKSFDRQCQIAFSAAEGDITNSFLGLKSKLAVEKRVGMLNTIATNAPRSKIGARALLKIGDIYVEEKKIDKAVEHYRKVAIEYPGTDNAGEAQFRIGKTLLDQARRGNQDQANLNAASTALKDYLALFPHHRHNAEARQLVASIGGRDLQNSFEIASFYEQKGDLKSARFYYEEVVRRSPSGPLHDQAKARLAAIGAN